MRQCRPNLDTNPLPIQQGFTKSWLIKLKGSDWPLEKLRIPNGYLRA